MPLSVSLAGVYAPAAKPVLAGVYALPVPTGNEWCMQLCTMVQYGAYNMVHTIWCIQYGAYNMVHTIWCIQYIAYNMVHAYNMMHTIWCIQYGAYNCTQSSPAILVDRVLKLFLLFRGTGIPHDEGVVAGMIDILVNGHQINIMQSDVDPDTRLVQISGLTEPEEVRLLLVVRDVVDRFQVTRGMQIFQE